MARRSDRHRVSRPDRPLAAGLGQRGTGGGRPCPLLGGGRSATSDLARCRFERGHYQIVQEGRRPMAEITRILCPVDFSDTSQHALEHAFAFARWYEARVTVLHVMSVPLPVMPLT